MEPKVTEIITTIKHSMIRAFDRTSSETGLNIHRVHDLMDTLIEELFHPSARWSIEKYLEHLQTSEQEKEAT